MHSGGLDNSIVSTHWQQVEVELLSRVRRAEAEFKQASAEHKEQAGERYRLALDEFAQLVLNRRFPS